MAETRFEGRSPVARYWLSKCEGFAVTGGEHGVVEELIRDADPFVTTRLVVRTGRKRRAVVPAEAVAAVDPAERIVFVARRLRRRPARSAMQRASLGARRVSPAVARTRRASVTAAAATAAVTRRNAPKVAAYLRRKGAPAAAVVRRSFALLVAEAVGTARMLGRRRTVS
jgi:hypothetical protein